MKKHIWKTITFLCLITILYLSFFTPDGGESHSLFKHQDKIGHFIFYSILTYSLMKLFINEIIIEKPIIFSITISLLFGGLIELSQNYLTNSREGSIVDLIFNTLGTLFTQILIKIYPPLFFFK